MSQLGEALSGQGRYAEAEPLVVGGYEGMKAREAKIPAGGPTPPARGRRAGRPALRGLGQARPGRGVEAQLGLADLPADVFAAP